jgi:hypothetical protein
MRVMGCFRVSQPVCNKKSYVESENTYAEGTYKKGYSKNKPVHGVLPRTVFYQKKKN